MRAEYLRIIRCQSRAIAYGAARPWWSKSDSMSPSRTSEKIRRGTLQSNLEVPKVFTAFVKSCCMRDDRTALSMSLLLFGFFYILSEYFRLSFELDRRVLPKRVYVWFSRCFGFISSLWTKTRCGFHRELQEHTKYPKYITPCYKVRIMVWDKRMPGLKRGTGKYGFGSGKRFRIWKTGGTPLTEILAE